MQKSIHHSVNIVLRWALYGFLLLCTACTPATLSTALESIRVQYSFAAQPWLPKLNNCSGKNVLTAELRAAEFQDPKSADLVMRIGQPETLSTPAYQIGTDDLMVIVNRQNSINKLTGEQVRALFTGRIQTWNSINGTDSPVQVWVFPTSEDVQQIFEQSVLGGSPVTSLARLANSPEEMSQSVSKDVNAIGIITRRWKTNNTSDVFTAASSLPILALTRSEPRAALAQMLACMQK
jgi:hypothetical protein